MHIVLRLTCVSLWFSVGALAQTPDPLPKTINDIVAQLKTMKPDSAVLANAAATIASEPPAAADRASLVSYYLKRSRANRVSGTVEAMLRDARKAAELAHGMNNRTEWEALIELSDAEGWGGNVLNAIKAREEQSKARSLGWALGGYAYVAYLSGGIGDIDRAENSLRHAEGVLTTLRSERDWFVMSSDWIGTLQRCRASVLRAKGKYAEAEVALREALQRTDESIEINQRQNYTAPVLLETTREGVERELASVLVKLGRLQEAEWHARSAMQRILRRVTGSSPQIPLVLGTMIAILYEEGRYAESAALATIATEMLALSGAQSTARRFSVLLTLEGNSLVALGQYASALNRYGRINAGDTSDPALQHSVRKGNASWALALIKTGNADEATTMLSALLKDWGRWQDPESVEIGIVQGELGMALAARGEKTAALIQFRSAMRALLFPRNLSEATPATAARIGLIVEAYIGLLAELHYAGEKVRDGQDLVADAFRLADAIRGRSVQSAVAAAAVRTSARTPVLGELTRKDQDLSRELLALYEAINTQLALPPDQQLPEVMVHAHARIDAIGIERRALAISIQKDFPAYANLILPKPATVQDARQALADGEALMSVLVTRNGSYVWAIPKTGAVAFSASPLNGAEVSALVGSLRAGLDPGQVPIDQLASFDLDAGYRLYRELLLPVESGWREAKTVLIVTNGALAELPLAVLPTQQVKLAASPELMFHGFRNVPWLAKRVAITQLPSVSAFVTLRALEPLKMERLPFIGFGDPQFSKFVTGPTGDTRGVRLRNLAIPHPPHEGTEAQFATGRGLAAEIAPADWLRYEQLTPLPDTRDEILAIAAALKADPQKDVYFGTRATVRAVTSLDLSKRRVVAFATHGLLPGDMPNLTQPALALAADADPKQSPLLTLDDILGLKLNADWVVLSACNTAAGDGEGAEAISGLGRGFFYAGSRALLVTHWPVETVSARKLVTGVFERVASDSSLSRAEALRQSMLALIDENAVDAATGRPLFSYAHPIFWAPYALYGDPSR